MATPLDFLLPALAPTPRTTQFPVPSVVVAASGSQNFESFNLAGVPLPGQWLLVDATRTFGWQMRKGYGLTGATIVPIGDDLMTAKFAIKIWTSSDAGVYRTLLKTLLKKPAGVLPGVPTSAGMGVDHPSLKDMGISAVVVKSVTPLFSPLVTSGGKGPWTAAVEFWEFRAPLPAIPTPSTVYPDRAPPNPSAQDSLDAENNRLANQFAAQGNALANKMLGGPKP